MDINIYIYKIVESIKNIDNPNKTTTKTNKGKPSVSFDISDESIDIKPEHTVKPEQSVKPEQTVKPEQIKQSEQRKQKTQ